jgi:hypothetical protein
LTSAQSDRRELWVLGKDDPKELGAKRRAIDVSPKRPKGAMGKSD